MLCSSPGERALYRTALLPTLRSAKRRLQRLALERLLALRVARDAVRLAALTFDDGPDPVQTPALLATLRHLDVRATFFLLGCNASAHPSIVQDLAAAGMEIGSHTMTHQPLRGLSLEAQLDEIAAGAAAVASAAGCPVRLFRPPFGDFDATTRDALTATGQTMVLWNVDPKEWSGIGATRLTRRVILGARNPSIIVLHDFAPPTVAALPEIVAAFRWAGYTFVTVSELREATLNRTPVPAPIAGTLPAC
jgi:peptidoglycan-N-acetylglucosamine deacetylase